jgi:hypothetical protein
MPLTDTCSQKMDGVARIVECKILGRGLWGEDGQVVWWRRADGSEMPLPGKVVEGEPTVVLLDYAIDRLHGEVEQTEPPDQVRVRAEGRELAYRLGQATVEVNGTQHDVPAPFALFYERLVGPLVVLEVAFP